MWRAIGARMALLVHTRNVGRPLAVLAVIAQTGCASSPIRSAPAMSAPTCIRLDHLLAAFIGLAVTKDRKGELGQLKGEYDAVDLSLRTRQCTLRPARR